MGTDFKEYKQALMEGLKMPYGKHKGMHPSDLPLDYCEWLRDNGVDKTIGKTFYKAISTRLKTRCTRLEMGEAWMMCIDCNAKLFSFDGYEDKTTICPTPKECDED